MKSAKENGTMNTSKSVLRKGEFRRRKRQCIDLVKCCLGTLVLVLGLVFVWQAFNTESKFVEDTETNEKQMRNWKKQDSQTMSRSAGNLILVNKEHALPEDYQIRLHDLENGRCAVGEEMYDALKEMLTDGSEEGFEFVVASGYRSRERQQELLDEAIQTAMENDGLSRQQAYERATRETMPPGYSEHETGLAVDIVSLKYQLLDEQQEYTAENQWLRENCSKYGFILRYPPEAEAITGISYEPWHFRYVGKEAAKEITEQGITLEEYLG